MSKAVLTPLPPRDAIAALRRRGASLPETFDWRDLWEDQHQSSFTVAKSAGFDILTDIRDAVEDAPADGTTLRDFKGRLQPVLEARGWWGKGPAYDPETGTMPEAQLGSARRLQTIFETNLRTSYAQGHWARFEREKKDRPWLRYVALMDGRTRPEHAARHNVCLPVDHPFWDTWAPPCGWGCRCTLQSLSDRDVARLQREGEPLIFDPPADRMVEYINPRGDGEPQMIPAGIDPGWAYNPGKISLNAASAIERVLTGPPGWTTAALESMVPAAQETAYRRWMTALLDGRQVNIGAMPVGRLPDEVAAIVKAAPDEAVIVMPQGRLSHSTRPEKVAINRDPDERILLRAPQLLANPIAILRQPDGNLVYLLERSATQWTRIIVEPGYRLKGKALKGRPRIVRTAIRTVDRVPIITYPRSGEYEIVWGRI